MMKTKDFFLPGQSPETRENWHRLFGLIEEGRYDQVLEALGKELEVNREHSRTALSDLYGVIRQICAACTHFQAEANQYKQAGEKATKSENDLKQQLYALFNLASDREVAETAPKSALAENRSLMPDHIPADLTIYCFGPFRVFCDDRLVSPWSSHKSLSIFKYLAIYHPSPVSKEILMDLFWSDAGTEAARRNLHQAIYSLRQTLRRWATDQHLIRFENNCYFLNPKLKIWFDYAEFERHLQAGQHWEKRGNLSEAVLEYTLAESLYRGDLLEEDPYEDWTRLPREKHRNAYLDLADYLSEYFQQQGNNRAAIEICQKILARDNCYENAHRRLMQCYQRQGERQRALRQYRSCVKALKQELDVTPSGETQMLFKKIVNES